MAHPKYRSANNELHYGILDAVYKDSHINWANIQTDDSAPVRRQMDKIWHGFNEASTKYLPDGRSYQTKGAAEIGSSDEDYH